MSWIQSLIVVSISFLISRLIIDAGLHQAFIDNILRRSRAQIPALVTGIMGISYVLSLFFSNTVVVLAMIPVIRILGQGAADEESKRRLSTHLILALIYGANIGGMGSLTGTSLNIFAVGYIELYAVPGRESVTFFSWLLYGLPGSLIMLILARLVLKWGEKRIAAIEIGAVNFQREHAPHLRRVAFIFFANVGLFTLLTALQFLFKPPPILIRFNIIDIIFFIYLFLFIFFSFIFPRGRGFLRTSAENTVSFILFILLSPFIFVAESLREIGIRFRIKGSLVPRILDRAISGSFNGIWILLFKGRIEDLKKDRRKSAISINRILYDLPFFGLVFMGAIVLSVFLLVKAGDNPATSQIDGIVVRFIEAAVQQVFPHIGQGIIFVFGLVFISIFLTEIVNNTTVVLVAFPVIVGMASVLPADPLFILLAVTVAANGAFMTPIATPVNAVAFAGVPGVSLKKMLRRGLVMNMVAGLWVFLWFGLLSRL